MLLDLFGLFTNFINLILGIGTPQKFPPPLPAAEEREYFKKFMSTRDEDARQKLILHNLRLVSHIVRKYYASSPNGEDLVSVGTIGLCKAVDSFSVENGARFATYAAKCIQNAILSLRNARKIADTKNEAVRIDPPRFFCFAIWL